MMRTSAIFADRPLSGASSTDDPTDARTEFDLRRLVNELALENEDLRAKVEIIVENNAGLYDENADLRRQNDALRAHHARLQAALDKRDDELRNARAQLTRAHADALASAATAPPAAAAAVAMTALTALTTGPALREAPIAPSAASGGAAATRLVRMLRLIQDLVDSLRQELVLSASGSSINLDPNARSASPPPGDSMSLSSSQQRAAKVLDALDRLAESVQLEADAAAHAMQAAFEDKVAALEAEISALRRALDTTSSDAREMRAQADHAAAQLRQVARAVQNAQSDAARAMMERDSARADGARVAVALKKAEDEARNLREDHFRLRRKVATDAAELDRLRAEVDRLSAQLRETLVASVNMAARGDDTLARTSAANTSAEPSRTSKDPSLSNVSIDAPILLSPGTAAINDAALAAQLAPHVEAVESLVAAWTSSPSTVPTAADLAVLRDHMHQLAVLDLTEKLRRAAEGRARLAMTVRQQQQDLNETRAALKVSRTSEDFLLSEVEVLKRLGGTTSPTVAAARVDWGEFLLAELRRLVQQQRDDAANRVPSSRDPQALDDEVQTLTKYISQILNRVFESGDPALVENVLSRDAIGGAVSTTSAHHGSSWRDLASGLLHDATRRRGSGTNRSSTRNAESPRSPRSPRSPTMTPPDLPARPSAQATRRATKSPSMTPASDPPIPPPRPAPAAARRSGLFRGFWSSSSPNGDQERRDSYTGAAASAAPSPGPAAPATSTKRRGGNGHGSSRLSLAMFSPTSQGSGSVRPTSQGGDRRATAVIAAAKPGGAGVLR
ncbi:hypothetical protein GGF31_008449 [Allomyces arbusculus]|nr:hypothetical protein GGF31_008449 [Allomyces arbusculus]